MNIVAIAANNQVTFLKFDTTHQADTKIRKVLGALKVGSAFTKTIQESFVKARVMASELKHIPVLCLMLLDSGELQPFAFVAENADEAVKVFNKAANHANAVGGAITETTVMFA